MFFAEEKCGLCGKCVSVCPEQAHTVKENTHIFDRSKCVLCGRCAEECPGNVLELVAREMSADAVIADVMRDKIFYENSGGGVTLSGGEPMLQFEFACELLEKAKERGLHTCIETCGYAKGEQYEKIAGLVDIFLFDYKETDEKRHLSYTGASNRLILENLRLIDSLGASIILRCPIIPSLNDRDDHFRGIADTANSLTGIKEINVEPYHPLGSGKAERLGKAYPLDGVVFPDEAQVREWMDRIQQYTDVTVRKA